MTNDRLVFLLEESLTIGESIDYELNGIDSEITQAKKGGNLSLEYMDEKSKIIRKLVRDLQHAVRLAMKEETK